MLYEVNIGVRPYFTTTDAMLNNSLFSKFMEKHGLEIYKGESTRDVICLDFDFGSKSYEEEHKRISGLLTKDYKTPESIEKLEYALARCEANKEKYCKKSRDELREEFYKNGVDITYHRRDKEGNILSSTTIHYKMLFRTPAKAKLGQVIFINEQLYDVAYDWMTMGLGKKMPSEKAKIVELSAYAPLTTSTIVGTMKMKTSHLLILKDQDSIFKTMANIVSAEEYKTRSGATQKKCVVTRGETEVVNTIWDGMALIESSVVPEWVNGMALLRNHFFKACAFKANIQQFFRDWCAENDKDYDKFMVKDYFGNYHYVKDIWMITTDNAIKWKKFQDLMGADSVEAYHYWCRKIKEDGSTWGIVKTDHTSKLGASQQLSYQMVNTLPCSAEDVREIASESINYVETLKSDDYEFERFLRKNANAINNYEMLADLYRHNPAFANSKLFRKEKSTIIKQYVFKLRKGKITVNGDNLTVCGNPYALLLYSVGDDWRSDPTLKPESGTIQCYTTRFDDGEYLCAFRNPHNSPNNCAYLHNVHSEEMKKYFNFSPNIMAVNCIETDVQSRMNGEDFDSDFNLVTNNPAMVKAAQRCYLEYPTIVNALKESGITYNNTPIDYAIMDNKFSKSRIGIGYSSNLAQLAMTYYWTELQKELPNEDRLKELYDNFVILSVIAQIIIDSCKREYEIDSNKEIDRICHLPCMQMERPYINEHGKLKYHKVDFPKFMKYTREIAVTKDGKELPQEDIFQSQSKLRRRINHDLVCPMNWLEEWLDKIQGMSTSMTTPTEEFFVKIKGSANKRQMSKIMEYVEEYDKYVKYIMATNNDIDADAYYLIYKKSEEVLERVQTIRIGNLATINRLIEVSLGISTECGQSQTRSYDPTKYTRKVLNVLYKYDPDKFLKNWSKMT